jgi:rhodanese-related sulfurtransferase/rubrerythrin
MMSFVDLFQPVSEWSTDQLRAYLVDHHPDDYQLLDVRMLREYSEQHLPGARWVPAEELPECLKDFAPDKTTVVYCTSGIRSRAAVAVLNRAGFQQAHSLHGGIRSWQGHLPADLPETCFDHFALAQSAEDFTVLAWQLEENTRRFYEELAETIDTPNVAAIFAELAAAESHHKSTLQAVWEGLMGHAAPDDFPKGLELALAEGRMEGGLNVAEALLWVENRTAEDALELAMAIEINAYDHYLNLYQDLEDDNARRVFELLAAEERHHLRSLGRALDERNS